MYKLRKTYFDARTYPISNKLSLVPYCMWNGFSNAEPYDFQETIFCVKACRAGQYLDSTYTCTPCPTLCPTCYNAAKCTSCINDQYYLMSDVCIPCNASLPYCITCSGNTSSTRICTQCITNYILTVSNSCLGCAVAMMNCFSCTNLTYCIACVSNNYGFNTSAGYCKLCKDNYLGCQ